MATFSIVDADSVPGSKAKAKATPATDFKVWLTQTYADECALASKKIPVLVLRNAKRSTRWVQTENRIPGGVEMRWVSEKSERYCSSGCCYWGSRINLVLGKDEEDRKLVALHELAHWLAPKRDGHSVRFWKKAFDLFEKYKLDMTYAARRSANYKALARKEALKRGIQF